MKNPFLPLLIMLLNPFASYAENRITKAVYLQAIIKAEAELWQEYQQSLEKWRQVDKAAAQGLAFIEVENVQHHIGASIDSKLDARVKTIVVGDGAHVVKIIRDDHAAKAQLRSQQTGDRIGWQPGVKKNF